MDPTAGKRGEPVSVPWQLCVLENPLAALSLSEGPHILHRADISLAELGLREAAPHAVIPQARGSTLYLKMPAQLLRSRQEEGSSYVFQLLFGKPQTVYHGEFLGQIPTFRTLLD